MEFNEFLVSVKKVKSTRKHKITNSFGIADAYKYYCKNIDKDLYKKVSRSEFGLIVNAMNKVISDEIVLNKELVLPSGIGSIEILKYNVSSKILDDGTFFCNKPKDFMATLRLWYEDEESRRLRTVVRHDTDYVFRLRYIKKKSRFKNSSYFFMRFNRSLRQKLKNNINNNKKYDTYEYKLNEYKSDIW